MRMTYDPAADAAYLYVTERGPEAPGVAHGPRRSSQA